MHSEIARNDSASAAVSAELRDLPTLSMPQDVVDRIARALVAQGRRALIEDEVIDLTTSAPELDELLVGQYGARRRRTTA